MAVTQLIEVKMLDDGRQFISRDDVSKHPHVARFVKRFHDYWTKDVILDGYVSPVLKEPK